ncbi:MAG TPA: hypothetical protein VHZ98_02640 [Galbitalea sp.]|nr:hypothetical protein [Galbitalea sp.]
MCAATIASISNDLRRVSDLVRGGRNNALAHSWIDEMYVNVLRTIATGTPDPEALASEALKAETIEFDRLFDK